MTSDDDTIQAGRLVLHEGSRLLDGPRGTVRLYPRHYAAMRLLMRRMDMMVSRDALMTAVYPDPDIEPETGQVMLRQCIMHMRTILVALGEDNLRIDWERDGGYVLSRVTR